MSGFFFFVFDSLQGNDEIIWKALFINTGVIMSVCGWWYRIVSCFALFRLLHSFHGEANSSARQGPLRYEAPPKAWRTDPQDGSRPFQKREIHTGALVSQHSEGKRQGERKRQRPQYHLQPQTEEILSEYRGMGTILVHTLTLGRWSFLRTDDDLFLCLLWCFFTIRFKHTCGFEWLC